VDGADSSEQEVRARAGMHAWRALPTAHPCPMPAQVCTFICARLDSSALGALLNVVVFGIKHLLSTAVYRGQLLIVNARPRITFSLRLRMPPPPAIAAGPDEHDPSQEPQSLPTHAVAASGESAGDRAALS
jgi:hypothetical protein